MAPLEKRTGRFTIFYYSSLLEPEALLRALSRGRMVEGRGRGGIKIIEAGGLKLVSRKYVHGGLFRAFTRDLFLWQNRATSEAEIMAHLGEKGFPVVVPFCAIVERLFLVKRLYLVTYLQEGAVELLEYFQRSTRKERLRCVRRLAELLWLLKQADVYHPDFHLRNVLVVPGNRLAFLDFDRARKRPVNDRDMNAMFRRMGRFADKMVRQGLLDTNDEEKTLFLRTYARLSGRDFTEEMRAAARRTSYLNRLGWFIEWLLFRRGFSKGN
jgi:tRNA A-37 threonylcarbamoyl transferase component Bud32